MKAINLHYFGEENLNGFNASQSVFSSPTYLMRQAIKPNMPPLPIMVSTVFKSGTQLLEFLVVNMLGVIANTPSMEAGCDYGNAEVISFQGSNLFVWHSVPSAAVKARLRAESAKPIFLIRNIYDLAVSQYFHFAEDFDAATGHSTGTKAYFAEMSREEGLALVLCGATSEYFHWHGFGYYLHQIQEILKFSKEYPCHVVVYDRLVRYKRAEIEKLATFMNMQITPEFTEELLVNSTLQAMRKSWDDLYGCANHFRRGAPGDHVNVLKPFHYHMINHLVLSSAPELGDLCEELEFGDILDPRAFCIEPQ